MERLTERYENGTAMIKGCGANCKYGFVYCRKEDWENCKTTEDVIEKLADYEDAEENGLLLRLDSKDKLVEILATKLFNSEFGVCYMCTNPMKNVTLDGVNNGCDGGCNTSEEFTVDDFLKKIVSEINRKKALADMGV